MGLQSRLAELVQLRLDDFLARQEERLAPLGPDTAPLLAAARDFLCGGKRLRAYGVALGFLACRELSLEDPLSDDAQAVISAAAALELFHAAALVHDDVIDQSETRRSAPSTYMRFAVQHQQQGWLGDAIHFGIASAILLGDLLQSWADELFQEATFAASPQAARRARVMFNRMRTDVAFGQHFDVLEEQYPHFAPTQEQLERATRVLLFKSAKYSVEEPLLIGAALAGASVELEKALSDFGVPAGIAFQLRDDVLGIFGDAEVTGKPAGDDLVQGKRTVLVTLARDELSGSVLRLFDELFGSSDIEELQLEMLQRTIRETGALERVEGMITKNTDIAQRAARSAEVHANAVELLVDLADRLAYRAK